MPWKVLKKTTMISKRNIQNRPLYLKKICIFLNHVGDTCWLTVFLVCSVSHGLLWTVLLNILYSELQKNNNKQIHSNTDTALYSRKVADEQSVQLLLFTMTLPCAAHDFVDILHLAGPCHLIPSSFTICS